MIFYTGIRASECCGLTWNNIDFDNCTISIAKEYMKVPMFKFIYGKSVRDGYKRDFTDLKSKSSYRKKQSQFERDARLYKIYWSLE